MREDKMGGIKKFRSFEEADDALHCFELDQEYFERIAQLWYFVDRLCPRDYARGIFRYRSIEEANRQAEEWLEENTKHFREQRRRNEDPQKP
jgi:hypothetical protein